MTNTEITITQTDSPSRSKMAGPCWIAIGDTYATESGRTITAEPGDTLTVTGKATLRRSSRATTDRASWEIEGTGDPADVVTVSIGSPQSVTATITGARRI